MSSKYIIRGPYYKDELEGLSLGQQLYNSLQTKNSAIIDGETGTEVSFKSIFEKTCQLALALKNHGITQNNIIGIFSENSIEYVYPIVAGLYLGCVVTTFNPGYTFGELLHTAHISQPILIFCSKATMPKLVKLKEQIPSLKKIIILDAKGSNDCENLDDFICRNTENTTEYIFKPVDVDVQNHLAFILYSSGTTGLPKGVQVTHKNFTAATSITRNPAYHIKYEPGSIATLGLLPFFHAYGLLVILIALIKAPKLVVMKTFKPEIYLKFLQDYEIGNLHLVPSLANFMAKHPMVDVYDLSAIKQVICGAAPLSKKTQEALLKRFPKIILRQGYGMTETTGGVLNFPLGAFKSGSIGKIYPNASAKVIDEKGVALEPYKPGEFCFKGDMVMKGYFKNEEATKQAIDKEGWLHTGDLGYYDEEGYFYIVDRVKELIKYQGFQVAPAEIEMLLLAHPNIVDAGVVGRPDEKAGELPVAFVVCQPGKNLTKKDVKDFVASQLSSPKHLRGGVMFLDNIPRNASGKILRNELKKLLQTQKSKL